MSVSGLVGFQRTARAAANVAAAVGDRLAAFASFRPGAGQIHRLPQTQFVDMIRGLGAVGMAPDEVVPLPRLLDGRRIATIHACLEANPRGAELRFLGSQHRVVTPGVDRHLPRAQVVLGDRHHRAEHLVLFEPHRTWTQHLPVHCEGIRQPIGLDDAHQRRNPRPRLVEDARGEQVPTGRRAENITSVQRDHAAAEIRHGEVLHRHPVRKPLQRPDSQIRGPGSAIPGHFEPAGRQQFPAMRVGNRQRQTTVCVPIRKSVHPRPFLRAGNQFRREFAQFEGLEARHVQLCLLPGRGVDRAQVYTAHRLDTE